MTLEDYVEAVQFRAEDQPPDPSRWVDEMRAASDRASFAGIG